MASHESPSQENSWQVNGWPMRETDTLRDILKTLSKGYKNGMERALSNPSVSAGVSSQKTQLTLAFPGSSSGCLLTMELPTWVTIPRPLKWYKKASVRGCLQLSQRFWLSNCLTRMCICRMGKFFAVASFSLFWNMQAWGQYKVNPARRWRWWRKGKTNTAMDPSTSQEATESKDGGSGQSGVRERWDQEKTGTLGRYRQKKKCFTEFDIAP